MPRPKKKLTKRQRLARVKNIAKARKSRWASVRLPLPMSNLRSRVRLALNTIVEEELKALLEPKS